MMHGQESSPAKLLSVSILLRHGARGPGASETSPFSEITDVCSQWNATEYEHLTPIGHEMIKFLGGWFAQKYSGRFPIPRVMFRCSKSGRAMESGDDFIKGFNDAISDDVQTVSEKPKPFIYATEKAIDEDYFFRPWKVHKKVVDKIKIEAQTDPQFVEIASSNREFLSNLFIAAGAKQEMVNNDYKCFWSTTHLFALLECEAYWHVPNTRTALTKRIPNNMKQKLEELACQVWSRRFIYPLVDPVLGAPLSVEIFQQSFRENYNINIYSGHDYTILSVLGSLGILKVLDQASQFGCFVIFELWDKKVEHNEDIGKVISRDCVESVIISTSGSAEIDLLEKITLDSSNTDDGIVLGEEKKKESENEKWKKGTESKDVMKEIINATYTAVKNKNTKEIKKDEDESKNERSIENEKKYNKIGNDEDNDEEYDVHDNFADDMSISGDDTSLPNNGNTGENGKNKRNDDDVIETKKSTKLQNNFLSEIIVDDSRILRIKANFSPFGVHDKSSSSKYSIKEEKIILLAEMNIEEIKKKHDYLFESLSSRGFFVPCQNSV